MNKYLLILTAFFVLAASASHAQTAGKATPKTAPAAKAAPKLTDADKMMCDKNWQIVSVEEWAVVTKPPGEKNKNDMMKLTTDMKYDVVMFGIRHTGTWKKTGQYIYFTDDGGAFKFNFKVLSVDATKMKVDHYSDEDGHSIFEYEAK
ncbi:MAG: hypothetical protein ACJ77K_04795 [Bacteroidia bacterium]